MYVTMTPVLCLWVQEEEEECIISLDQTLPDAMLIQSVDNMPNTSPAGIYRSPVHYYNCPGLTDWIKMAAGNMSCSDFYHHLVVSLASAAHTCCHSLLTN